MASFGYNLDNEGRVIICGYGNYENKLNGDEPFKDFDIVNYQLINVEWIYNPIIMIPENISKLQAVTYLLELNRYDELINKLNEDTTGKSMILFNAAHQLDRDSNMVNQIGQALQIDLDDFFVEASKILV